MQKNACKTQVDSDPNIWKPSQKHGTYANISIVMSDATIIITLLTNEYKITAKNVVKN